MISYIRGALEIKGDNYIVIECGGIGYQLMVSGKFMEKLPPVHSEIKVSTYMYIREDEISLFGFENADELNVFKILLGVSGVGPKVAMSLLSTLTVNELRLAVISEDVKAISKANGIGAKGASRLKDKLSMEDMIDAAYNDSVAVQTAAGDVRTNVISALTALGYSGVEAGRAVSRVDGSADMDEEQLLKAALRFMI
jgi:Holliday junction DNA helicase RuvA